MKLWTSTKKLKGGHEIWTWWKGREKHYTALHIPNIPIEVSPFLMIEAFNDQETVARTRVANTSYIPYPDRYPMWCKVDGSYITIGSYFTI